MSAGDLVETTTTLAQEFRVLAGILLLSLVTVETGGLYLVRIVTGHIESTAFQLSFARAGHAHAGVLLILALVTLLVADAAGETGALGRTSAGGVAAAALLMPAGFFFSSMGRGRTAPNKLVWLVFVGAALLALSLASLGIGLLVR